jgi:hypothetical protein
MCDAARALNESVQCIRHVPPWKGVRGMLNSHRNSRQHQWTHPPSPLPRGNHEVRPCAPRSLNCRIQDNAERSTMYHKPRPGFRPTLRAAAPQPFTQHLPYSYNMSIKSPSFRRIARRPTPQTRNPKPQHTGRQARSPTSNHSRQWLFRSPAVQRLGLIYRGVFKAGGWRKRGWRKTLSLITASLWRSKCTWADLLVPFPGQASPRGGHGFQPSTTTLPASRGCASKLFV